MDAPVNPPRALLRRAWDEIPCNQIKRFKKLGVVNRKILWLGQVRFARGVWQLIMNGFEVALLSLLERMGKASEQEVEFMKKRACTTLAQSTLIKFFFACTSLIVLYLHAMIISELNLLSFLGSN